MKKDMSKLSRPHVFMLLLMLLLSSGCALFTPNQRSEKWYSDKIDFANSRLHPGAISAETVTESESIGETIKEVSELICRDRNDSLENPGNQIFIHITVKERPFYLRGELFYTSTLLMKITGTPEKGEEPEGIILITRDGRRSIGSTKELTLLLKRGFACIPK